MVERTHAMNDEDVIRMTHRSSSSSSSRGGGTDITSSLASMSLGDDSVGMDGAMLGGGGVGISKSSFVIPYDVRNLMIRTIMAVCVCCLVKGVISTLLQVTPTRARAESSRGSCRCYNCSRTSSATCYQTDNDHDHHHQRQHHQHNAKSNNGPCCSPVTSCVLSPSCSSPSPFARFITRWTWLPTCLCVYAALRHFHMTNDACKEELAITLVIVGIVGKVVYSKIHDVMMSARRRQ